MTRKEREPVIEPMSEEGFYDKLHQLEDYWANIVINAKLKVMELAEMREKACRAVDEGQTVHYFTMNGEPMIETYPKERAGFIRDVQCPNARTRS